MEKLINGIPGSRLLISSFPGLASVEPHDPTNNIEDSCADPGIFSGGGGGVGRGGRVRPKNDRKVLTSVFVFFLLVFSFVFNFIRGGGGPIANFYEHRKLDF